MNVNYLVSWGWCRSKENFVLKWMSIFQAAVVISSVSFVSYGSLRKCFLYEQLASMAAGGRVKEKVIPLHKDFLLDLKVSLDKYCVCLYCYLMLFERGYNPSFWRFSALYNLTIAILLKSLFCVVTKGIGISFFPPLVHISLWGSSTFSTVSVRGGISQVLALPRCRERRRTLESAGLWEGTGPRPLPQPPSCARSWIMHLPLGLLCCCVLTSGLKCVFVLSGELNLLLSVSALLGMEVWQVKIYKI